MADFVLIGEASHGTDMLRVHRYASGSKEEHDANDTLSDFRRFPRWMWRNETTLDRPSADPAGGV